MMVRSKVASVPPAETVTVAGTVTEDVSLDIRFTVRLVVTATGRLTRPCPASTPSPSVALGGTLTANRRGAKPVIETPSKSAPSRKGAGGGPSGASLNDLAQNCSVTFVYPARSMPKVTSLRAG